jgi:uncharacterized membrane-anchored protein YjiN (DUF445 family)
MNSKKYKMIQISEESHTMLKDWCKTNDKKMCKVIERWINERIKTVKIDPDKVLKSNPIYREH